MKPISKEWRPHASHKMCKPYSEVWSPAGTARFYSVQSCNKCGAELGRHPAGQFAEEQLFDPCPRKTIKKEVVNA